MIFTHLRNTSFLESLTSNVVNRDFKDQAMAMVTYDTGSVDDNTDRLNILEDWNSQKFASQELFSHNFPFAPSVEAGNPRYPEKDFTTVDVCKSEYLKALISLVRIINREILWGYQTDNSLSAFQFYCLLSDISIQIRKRCSPSDAPKHKDHDTCGLAMVLSITGNRSLLVGDSTFRMNPGDVYFGYPSDFLHQVRYPGSDNDITVSVVRTLNFGDPPHLHRANVDELITPRSQDIILFVDWVHSLEKSTINLLKKTLSTLDGVTDIDLKNNTIFIAIAHCSLLSSSVIKNLLELLFKKMAKGKSFGSVECLAGLWMERGYKAYNPFDEGTQTCSKDIDWTLTTTCIGLDRISLDKSPDDVLQKDINDIGSHDIPKVNLRAFYRGKKGVRRVERYHHILLIAISYGRNFLSFLRKSPNALIQVDWTWCLMVHHMFCTDDDWMHKADVFIDTLEAFSANFFCLLVVRSCLQPKIEIQHLSYCLKRLSLFSMNLDSLDTVKQSGKKRSLMPTPYDKCHTMSTVLQVLSLPPEITFVVDYPHKGN
jgi:hypothetical protein